jgi:hypothetical protein
MVRAANNRPQVKEEIVERKRYLELCQKCAAGCDIRVKYKDTEYYPYRYELGFDGSGKPIHTAILKDLKANSVVCVAFKDVKEC